MFPVSFSAHVRCPQVTHPPHTLIDPFYISSCPQPTLSLKLARPSFSPPTPLTPLPPPPAEPQRLLVGRRPRPPRPAAESAQEFLQPARAHGSRVSFYPWLHPPFFCKMREATSVILRFTLADFFYGFFFWVYFPEDQRRSNSNLTTIAILYHRFWTLNLSCVLAPTHDHTCLL